MTRDILRWNFKDLPKNDYIAVVMDPPWKKDYLSSQETATGITVEEFVC